MKKRKCSLRIIIVASLFITSVVFNLYLNTQYHKIKREITEKNKNIKEREKELNSSLEILTKIQNGKTTDYILTKLDFLDQKIAFVVNSDNKHYYNYDCMVETMKNKEYVFTIYSKSEAVLKGYNKYECKADIQTFDDYVKQNCNNIGKKYNFEKKKCE